MKSRRNKSGFTNPAADKIWNDHLGNNAFVRHRVQCTTCSRVYKEQIMGRPDAWCAEGERIFDEMFKEIATKIEEALVNQN